MREFRVGIQAAWTAFGGWLGWFFGGLDGALIVLLAFEIIDYITGVMVAAARHELSSSVGFHGLCRKACVLLLVGMCHLLDIYIIGKGAVLRTAVAFLFISNEGISILENMGNLGVPIPDKLKDFLVQLRDKETD